MKDFLKQINQQKIIFLSLFIPVFTNNVFIYLHISLPMLTLIHKFIQNNVMMQFLLGCTLVSSFYIDRRVTKVEDFLKTRLLDTLTDQITKVLKVRFSARLCSVCN